MLSLLFFIFFIRNTLTTPRFDCHPEPNATESKCEHRGCIWNTTCPTVETGPYYDFNDCPACFYPDDYGYIVSKEYTQSKSSNIYTIDIQQQNEYPSPYNQDIQNVSVKIEYETENRLHLKFSDLNTQRYEVPINLNTSSNSYSPSPTKYEAKFTENIGDMFGIQIYRKANNKLLIDTLMPGFIYSSQFLQINMKFGSNYSFIYGFGERFSNLRIPLNYTTVSSFARDVGDWYTFRNSYGVHPFGLFINQYNGNSFGIFIVNSNAMEFIVTPDPGLQYRTIGGILDMYIFLGPTPLDVIKQYWNIIGYPFMPPYWSLGFHLCRWGYHDLDTVKSVVDNMRYHKIPYDTQWVDIDYMNKYKIFTYDQTAFDGLPQFVNDTLHKAYNMKFINIIDPGIHNDTSYQAYVDGMEQDIYIKNADGTVYIGQVWPGSTAFPDFWRNSTIEWWIDYAQTWHNIVNYDGYWIDMNEPASFKSFSVCPINNTYESPPYVPVNLQQGDYDPYLQDHTICMSTRQAYDDTTTEHYNIHSLYGHSELMATYKALKQIHDRPFIISRATFSTSGKYGGHWMGDNTAKFEHMRQSISGMIMFNMFGIPMIGADICGFFDDTTIELCSRWMELGAFYPFSRNHNTMNAKPQDPPSLGEPVVSISRKYLQIRYSLLPYLYTLFYKAHKNGDIVVNSLWMIWNNDAMIYENHEQFLWGHKLLFSPALYQGQYFVNAYFPRMDSQNDTVERWYEFENGTEIVWDKLTDNYVNISTPLEQMNIHIRGGSIIPLQTLGSNDLTSAEARYRPYQLLVALDINNQAVGDIYIDDGISGDYDDMGYYDLIIFNASNGVLRTDVQHRGYDDLVNNVKVMDSIVIYGVESMDDVDLVDTKYGYEIVVKINGLEMNRKNVTYDNITKCLRIGLYPYLDIDDFMIEWNVTRKVTVIDSSDTTTWIASNGAWFLALLVIPLLVIIGVGMFVFKRHKMRRSVSNYQNFVSDSANNDQDVE